MSGGNAYQYDPEDRLEQLCDQSSVELHRLTEDSTAARAHEQFILMMLELHADYANSSKARNLLADWPQARQHVKFAIPLWLYKTQSASFLRQAVERKDMVEELAQALAQSQVEQVRTAYRQGLPLFGGAIPAGDDMLAYKLINSYAVLDKAAHLAHDSLKTLPEAGRGAAQADAAARKLLLERPRKVQDALLKVTREAYSHYSDDHLAWLLADKRLNDYKTTLVNRSVQGICSIGSTAWVIEQAGINRQALAGIPAVEAYLAGLVSLAYTQASSDLQTA
jgi:glutamate synthase (NADPH/NADH) large chain